MPVLRHVLHLVCLLFARAVDDAMGRTPPASASVAVQARDRDTACTSSSSEAGRCRSHPHPLPDCPSSCQHRQAQKTDRRTVLPFARAARPVPSRLLLASEECQSGRCSDAWMKTPSSSRGPPLLAALPAWTGHRRALDQAPQLLGAQCRSPVRPARGASIASAPPRGEPPVRGVATRNPSPPPSPQPAGRPRGSSPRPQSCTILGTRGRWRCPMMPGIAARLARWRGRECCRSAPQPPQTERMHSALLLWNAQPPPSDRAACGCSTSGRGHTTGAEHPVALIAPTVQPGGTRRKIHPLHRSEREQRAGPATRESTVGLEVTAIPVPRRCAAPIGHIALLHTGSGIPVVGFDTSVTPTTKQGFECERLYAVHSGGGVERS
eukprot:1402264-Prymnesium_polylepis.2